MVLCHKISSGDAFTSSNTKRQWQVRDIERLMAVTPKKLEVPQGFMRPPSRLRETCTYKALPFFFLLPSFLAFISIHFHLSALIHQGVRE